MLPKHSIGILTRSEKHENPAKTNYTYHKAPGSLPSENAARSFFDYKIFNHNHAYRLVLEYIETFYNTARVHNHCGYLSPNQYAAEYLSKMEENAMALTSLISFMPTA